MLEVAEAAEADAAHEATGTIRLDLVGDMIGVFRYFGDGMDHPKEEGSAVRPDAIAAGMTDDDGAARADIGEHEWCRVSLDGLKRSSSASTPTTGRPASPSPPGCRSTSRSRAVTSKSRKGVLRHRPALSPPTVTGKELTEEFEAVHWDEIEEGVVSDWEDLAHRLEVRGCPVRVGRPAPTGGVTTAEHPGSTPRTSAGPRPDSCQLQACGRCSELVHVVRRLAGCAHGQDGRSRRRSRCRHGQTLRHARPARPEYAS